MSALPDTDQGAAPPEPETVTVDTGYYKALEAVALAAGWLRSHARPVEREAGGMVFVDYRIGATEVARLDDALAEWYAAQEAQDARLRAARKVGEQMRLIA